MNKESKSKTNHFKEMQKNIRRPSFAERTTEKNCEKHYHAQKETNN